MAELYKRVRGRKFEQFIAMLPEVQDVLEETAFAVKARADVNLREAESRLHGLGGDAQIELDHGDIDWYVVLSDERGDKAALSIEFGRAPYIDPQSGEEWGGMDGLYILTRAAGLPKKARRVTPNKIKRRKE